MSVNSTETLAAASLAAAFDARLSEGVQLGVVGGKTAVAAALSLLDIRVRHVVRADRLPRRLMAVLIALIVLRFLWSADGEAAR